MDREVRRAVRAMVEAAAEAAAEAASGSGGGCNVNGGGGAIHLPNCDEWLGEREGEELDFSCGQAGNGGQGGSGGEGGAVGGEEPALQRVCENESALTSIERILSTIVSQSLTDAPMCAARRTVRTSPRA